MQSPRRTLPTDARLNANHDAHLNKQISRLSNLLALTVALLPALSCGLAAYLWLPGDAGGNSGEWPARIMWLLVLGGLLGGLTIKLLQSLLLRPVITAQDELRKREAHWRKVLKSQPAGVMLFGLDGQVQFINRSAISLFGLNEGDPRQIHDWWPVVLTDQIQRQKAQSLWLTLLDLPAEQSEPVGPTEFLIERRDGSALTLDVIASRLGDQILFLTTDVSERQHAMHNQQESLSRFEAAMEGSADGILVADLNGGITSINRRMIDLWRIPFDLVSQKDSETLFTYIGGQTSLPEDFGQETKRLGVASLEFSHSILHLKDGRVIERRSNPQILDGRPIGRVWTFREQTDHWHAEQALRQAHEFNRSIVSVLAEGILVVGLDYRIISCNKAAEKIIGAPKEHLVGNLIHPWAGGSVLRADGTFIPPDSFPVMRALQSGESQQDQVVGLQANGSDTIQWLTVNASPIIDAASGQITAAVTSLRDITDLRANQRQLEELAYYDPLTALPNRTLLTDRMTLALAQARRRNQLLAVCYLDLDDFKPVNDTYGHKAGDAVLIEIAGRIKASLRDVDTVCRLGGDEFVILLAELHTSTMAREILARTLDSISAPCLLSEGISATVSGSIGVALYPSDAADADQLIRLADQAMYRAKQAGRNRVEFF